MRSEQSPNAFAFGQHMMQSLMPDFYTGGLDGIQQKEEIRSLSSSPPMISKEAPL